MNPVSRECARSDRDCRDCTFHNCNCDCHKAKNPNWRSMVQHGQKRYFMAYGRSGVWYVMDRGTLQSTSVKTLATCTNRLDAVQMVYKLNKSSRPASPRGGSAKGK